MIVNTARGRVKTKNLAREPRVAVSIADPENPYRYLGIQGRVVEMTENGGDAHIDKMAKKYLGKDTYPFRTPGEVRVVVKIARTKSIRTGSARRVCSGGGLRRSFASGSARLRRARHSRGDT